MRARLKRRESNRIVTCGATVLAGGSSTRMGRQKARVRLGRKTMIGHVQAAAKAAGLSVRVIRRDAVSRCGPLGGIFTGLKTSRCDAELFLACDMPFVSPEWLRRLQKEFRARARGLFTGTPGAAGFPLLLPRTTLDTVARQIAKGDFSLRTLARIVRAKFIKLNPSRTMELTNVNTPAELKEARRLWAKGLASRTAGGKIRRKTRL